MLKLRDGKNLGKFEIKMGGRENGQRMYNAIKFIDYIENLPPNKMFGIKKLSKGITVLTKEEVISKKRLEKIIKKLHISDIEPWSEYKISGEILFELQELLEGS